MISGKLDEELRRMSGIVDHNIQSGAILLANESFASTRPMAFAGTMWTACTSCAPSACPMAPARSRCAPGEALATSFGKDLYDEIFGGDGSRERSVLSTLTPNRVTDVSRIRGTRRTQEDTRGHEGM